jgi:hypothetical protein
MPEARITCRACHENFGYFREDDCRLLAIAVFNVLEARARTCQQECEFKSFSQEVDGRLHIQQSWGGMPTLAVSFTPKDSENQSE